MVELHLAAVAFVRYQQNHVLCVQEHGLRQRVVVALVVCEVELGVEVVEEGPEAQFAKQGLVVLAVRDGGLGSLLFVASFLLATIHVEDMQGTTIPDAGEPVIVEAEGEREDIDLIAASSDLLQRITSLGVEQPDERALGQQ